MMITVVEQTSKPNLENIMTIKNFEDNGFEYEKTGEFINGIMWTRYEFTDNMRIFRGRVLVKKSANRSDIIDIFSESDHKDDFDY